MASLDFGIFREKFNEGKINKYQDNKENNLLKARKKTHTMKINKNACLFLNF